MDNKVKIKTVLGEKFININTVTLSHEHICCYSEYLHKMSKKYINKDDLILKAATVLKNLKQKYNLELFIDCTPVNLGRDIELLKKVSYMSGVEIVCSTGFYYTDEPVLNCMSAEKIAEYITEDANTVCAGAIKAAVEYESISDFNVKILKATAIAQKQTKLPIILHTNAHNFNGIKAVEILMQEGVNAEHINVGHLSDTDNIEYIKEFAKLGCYISLDRMYSNTSSDYINAKTKQIYSLSQAGYENKILLSHDDAVFMGFDKDPKIKEPRFNYIFEYIIPNIDCDIANKILCKNPISMLTNT